MPVTIKNTKMKYKDSNGEYVGVNAVAEQTTAEMVADIEDAAGDQIEAIETKGTEV